MALRSQHVADLGFWRYTTVVGELLEPFTPAGGWEAAAHQWVALAAVVDLPLHPGFREAWPQLRRLL